MRAIGLGDYFAAGTHPDIDQVGPRVKDCSGYRPRA